MNQRRSIIALALLVLLVAIGVGVWLLTRPPTIGVKPQIVSPLPLPLRKRVFVPVVARNYRQSKKCVGLSSGFSVEKMAEIGSRCTYIYSPGAADYPGIENAGMVHYPIVSPVTGSAPYFLGFNEPDLGRFGGGPPVTPQQAAEIWPLVIAVNPGKLAVSPAPSHLHPEWLEQFYAAHLARWGYPPKLDALAIHCYGGADFCRGIVTQVIGYAEQWDIAQVWVTEFAFTDAWQDRYPPGATWQSEAQRFIAWMDAEPRIARYYWWAMLYDSDDPEQWWNYGWYTQLYDWHTGALNERGKFYQTVR